MGEIERNSGRLTPKQDKAIECLLTKPTLTEAAEAAGVAESTLRRWRKEPAFSQAFVEARAMLLDGTLTRLQQATDKAIETLEDVMKAATDTPAARVSAARVVLEMALKQREATETRAIIERLEQQLAEAKAAGLLKGGGCPT